MTSNADRDISPIKYASNIDILNYNSPIDSTLKSNVKSI